MNRQSGIERREKREAIHLCYSFARKNEPWEKAKVVEEGGQGMMSARPREDRGGGRRSREKNRGRLNRERCQTPIVSTEIFVGWNFVLRRITERL